MRWLVRLTESVLRHDGAGWTWTGTVSATTTEGNHDE